MVAPKRVQVRQGSQSMPRVKKVSGWMRYTIAGLSCFVLSLCFLDRGQGCAQMTESPAPANSVTHLVIARPAIHRVIPDTLFGSFLEPIGSSTYGGLWAQVLENSSFEEGLWSANHVSEMLRAKPELHRASELGLPLPWQPLDSRQGSRYLTVRGNAGNSTQSLLLMSLPGKEVGVLQEVYLPVQRELDYVGSVMVKHVRGPVEVTLSLRRHAQPEQILATTTMQAGEEQWTEHPYRLTLKRGSVTPLEPVDFVISIRDDARVQLDNVLLNPADAVEGMDPDELEMAKDLQSPIIRFGGNFTSAYHWQDGIGPQAKRVSMLNASWGIPEYNTFGTDEFLRFCRLIGAQPQIALNLGTGTPQEAGEWVRYVDAHWGDHRGGLLWELGNELWGEFQIAYPAAQTNGQITLATSRAVRAVDPTARLIATGGDEDFFHDWNARQLAEPKGTFNYLSTHFVVNDRVDLPNASDEFRTMAALALPWGLAPRMQAIHQQAVDAGRPEVKVAFTEWLMVSDHRDGPNFTNMGGALFAGGLLNMLFRNTDSMAVSDMTGIMEFGGISKKRGQVYGAPAYWVLRAYSRARPHDLLALTSDGPAYSVTKGIRRLAEIEDVPYLDCVPATTEDQATLVMTCVNRSITQAQSAEIDFSAMLVGNGVAKISTLRADNILVENDEEDPRRVVPSENSRTVTSGKLVYSFPTASVTVLQVPLK